MVSDAAPRRIVGSVRAPGVRPRQGRPGAARPGWEAAAAAQGSAVLTGSLTTALDYPGHVRNKKPREQVRCDHLDSHGRL
jgi:hypothetical protein